MRPLRQALKKRDVIRANTQPAERKCISIFDSILQNTSVHAGTGLPVMTSLTAIRELSLASLSHKVPTRWTETATPVSCVTLGGRLFLHLENVFLP